jgi:hypothetical protein
MFPVPTSLKTKPFVIMAYIIISLSENFIKTRYDLWTFNISSGCWRGCTLLKRETFRRKPLISTDNSDL